MQHAPATTAPDPIIQLRDVHLRYAGADDEALRGISLDVPVGEYLCILGGNGSGKSTLAQLINALLVPTAGTVRVCGVDAAEQPDRALELRQQVAMVFQHPDDQMVTSIVADDVAFGPENLGVPQPQIAARVEEALAAVDMSACAQADPADLSGGQRQRVAIAGALAMHPRVLVLDEPAAMLDAKGRRAIQRIARGLNAQGITIVHITHFMDDALLADRVVVMSQGCIAQVGTPAEVFARRDELHRLGLELPFTLQLASELAPVLPELPTSGNADELAHAVSCALRDAGDTSEAPTGGNYTQNHENSPLNVHFPPLAVEKGPTADAEKEPSAAIKKEPTAAIAFRHVTFSYADEHNARKRPGIFARLRHACERGDKTATPHAPHGPLAVQDLSFTVPAGSLTALIGHTGSGKSTTVELACALKVPNAGEVLINGINTADLAHRSTIRAQIGYVAQLPERQLFAETTFDDIAFGPRNLDLPNDEVTARVTEALAEVGLDATPALLNRSPFTLSGGQQRAVSIAGILAMRTPILVLDEPMAGLDPVGQQRMRTLIAHLNQSGRTILVVTHNMDDVAELADHVIALEQGHLAASGTPRAVFTQAAEHVPGLPSALAFARRLAALGTPLDPEPLTLRNLVQEIQEVHRGCSR